MNNREKGIKAGFSILAFFIVAFSLALSISNGKFSTALFGIGFGAFVYAHALSPKFFLSKIPSNDRAFSRTSSNIAIIGLLILLLGLLVNKSGL